MEQNQLQLSTELANLPAVLSQNSGLADRAVTAVRKDIEQIKAIDLQTADIALIDNNDAVLNALQVKLKDAYTIMQDRRKPFTQKMDEIKALFTAEEKKVVSIGEEVKALRDGIAKEKGRRMQIAEQEKAAKMEKQQAVIEVKTYFSKYINDKFAEAFVELCYRLHDKFNAQTIATFGEYESTLKKWQPVLNGITWESFFAGILNPKPQLFTQSDTQAMIAEVEKVEKPRLSAEWTSKLTAKRDELIELIPSRKMELERISGDAVAAKEAEARIAQEREQIRLQAEQEKQDKESAIEQAAEVESMNSAFDAEIANPVVSITKGTVVKKVYKATTHKAWVAMLQSFVQHDMNRMTLEDLQKKFGFVRTACEARLNNGEELKAEGLIVDEDYSTRTSRKTKVA
jgi:hypothetical protein